MIARGAAWLAAVVAGSVVGIAAAVGFADSLLQ